jgi:hypothetical protein
LVLVVEAVQLLLVALVALHGCSVLQLIYVMPLAAVQA